MQNSLLDYCETDRQRQVVTAVINPKASNEAERIKPFWDSKFAAEYLTWLRAQ